MRIEQKINKYLNEKVSREDAMNKLKKVIKSAKTIEQLKMAEKMATNYYKMYGEKWYSLLDKEDASQLNKGVFKELYDALENQQDIIKHLKKVQIELNK
jgi:hypothetical protein